MTKEIQTNRPSSLQESLNFIAQLFELASAGLVNPTSLIKSVCQRSGLSSEGSQFTQGMINTAEQLREEVKNK